MSILIEYRELEKHLARQQETLNFLKSDARLKKELEFEARLHALLKEYGVGVREIIQILMPHGQHQLAKTGNPVDGRSRRKLKVYRNPHTEEVVQTKGGNHRTLKLWKRQHGAATVESWLTN
ncbi:histone-like nucleoid-structuring protein, MvaT/MvaU family [Pseudomonas zeae]|uniref:histone-like nucleoid-structuring protein, MvaT/MvaU family n=1 Tax=Pseudomonas zeae TaxID=2745510 RepID=UPI0039E076C6